LRVLLRVLGDRIAGLVDILVDNNALAFEVRVPRDVIVGPDVLEPVFLEFGLQLVLERRVDVNPNVRRAE
jgi:hypothetical protein